MNLSFQNYLLWKPKWKDIAARQHLGDSRKNACLEWRWKSLLGCKTRRARLKLTLSKTVAAWVPITLGRVNLHRFITFRYPIRGHLYDAQNLHAHNAVSLINCFYICSLTLKMSEIWERKSSSQTIKRRVPSCITARCRFFKIGIRYSCVCFENFTFFHFDDFLTL